MLFTELLRKQLQAQLEVIYFHLGNFVSNFFGDEEAKLALDEAMTYYMSFTNEHLYVQKHWVDEKGESQIQEVNIDYDGYNEWYRGLDL